MHEVGLKSSDKRTAPIENLFFQCSVIYKIAILKGFIFYAPIAVSVYVHLIIQRFTFQSIGPPSTQHLSVDFVTLSYRNQKPFGSFQIHSIILVQIPVFLVARALSKLILKLKNIQISQNILDTEGESSGIPYISVEFS